MTAGMPRPAWRILSKRPVDEPLVARPRPRSPGRGPGVVAVHDAGVPARGDLAQPVAEPVDARQRGEGVVHGRRQRADRDLDELVDRRTRGPGRASGAAPVTCACSSARLTVGAASAGHTRASGRPSTTKWPGRWSSWMTASARRAMSTSRRVARRTGGSRSSGRGTSRRTRRSARASSAADGPPSRTPLRLAGRRSTSASIASDRSRAMLGDDLGQLDRLRDVVDEVDQDAEVDEHEDERDGDRQVRDEVARRAVRDRAEREHRVDERRDEGAERDLRAAVADEVAQHPRPELRRRQGERDDRDREHEPDDGDDRGGDRRSGSGGRRRPSRCSPTTGSVRCPW